MAENLRIAVLASGEGTNLGAIIKAQDEGILGNARVSLVISDNPEAKALVRARESGITTAVIEKNSSITPEEFDGLLIDELGKASVDLVVLAGFMRVLGKKMVNAFSGRIINIHPALLPCFKGVSGVSDAFDYGVKVTGVTVHFVDEGVDTGPIILQGHVDVEQADTKLSLEQKIHALEHQLYPRAIRLFVDGKLKIEGRKVLILE